MSKSSFCMPMRTRLESESSESGLLRQDLLVKAGRVVVMAQGLQGGGLAEGCVLVFGREFQAAFKGEERGLRDLPGADG